MVIIARKTLAENIQLGIVISQYGCHRLAGEVLEFIWPWHGGIGD